MERMKQKTKKEKPNKCVEKDKSTFHGPDVKTLKENIKIKEILRTVKMNSSMRIKAPRGSRVMQNKDFNDSEDIFEDTISAEGQVIPTSATNTVLNDHIDSGIDFEGDCAYGENNSHAEVAKTHYNEEVEDDVDKSDICQSKSLSTGLNEISNIGDTSASHNAIAPTSPAESPLRSRKLSLDHKMLSRRKGLSQSEVDLHSVGKLPLERKSSFFRKKLDSFLKNTTEIFKRQPLGSKSTKSQRRGSKSSRISVSMQSLNENAAYVDESIDQYHEHGSVTSLRSTMTASNSSFSMNVSDRPPDQSEESLASSRHGLGSQPLDTSSIHCAPNVPRPFVDVPPAIQYALDDIVQPIPEVEADFDKLILTARQKLLVLIQAVSKMEVTREVKINANIFYHNILARSMRDNYKDEVVAEGGLIEFEMEDPNVPSHAIVKLRSKQLVDAQVSEFDVPDAPKK